LIKVSPVKRVKTINPRVFKKVPQPPKIEPRIIKEGIQPEKVIKTEPVMVKESILGISELPEVKRLTYTKKSDN
jgi:hypothetical protein